LNPNYPVFGINNPVIIELKTEPKESGLYDAILNAKEEFREYNIGVMPSRPDLIVGSRKGYGIFHLNKKLIDLVLDPEKPVHKLLGII
jgi:hypothetical protein